jgi:N-acyl-L-homoserine lactone synthetase
MELKNVITAVSLDYKFVECKTEKLIKKCQELRHLVYCEEKNWESEHNSKIEQDSYDDNSIHYLMVCRNTNEGIATFRFVMANELPVAEYMSSDNIFHPTRLPVGSVAEISRFSILKDYRGGELPGLLKLLFLLVGYESAKRGLVGAYMVMEKSLAMTLLRNKINCRQITEEFKLNGSRAIYFCSTVESLISIGSIIGFDKESLGRLFEPMFENEYRKVSYRH